MDLSYSVSHAYNSSNHGENNCQEEGEADEYS